MSNLQFIGIIAAYLASTIAICHYMSVNIAKRIDDIRDDIRDFKSEVRADIKELQKDIKSLNYGFVKFNQHYNEYIALEHPNLIPNKLAGDEK